MRRIVFLTVLQVYAIALAAIQTVSGVRTDEAKYLMDIPYPHPPAVRFLLGMFDSFPSQEMVVRVLFSSLMVHGVWLVWSMAKDLQQEHRTGLCMLWLVSGGVVLQAGTIMMAPITAMQILLLLFLMHKKAPDAAIGLVWLFSLFTAYQAVLFAPLLAFYFWNNECPLWEKAAYVCVPVLLLALYTLTNPLIPASMMIHGSRDLGSTITGRSLALLRLWAIGGSAVLSILGTKGIFHTRNPGLMLSFLLVVLYIALSRYDYYAVLFLPLFVGGVVASSSSFVFPRLNTLIACGIGLYLLSGFVQELHPSAARSTATLLRAEDAKNTLFIYGSFGHEWQYESPLPVRKMNDTVPEEAGALVCLETCPEWERRGWELIQVQPETWVRRHQLA
ncbi:hypothetical protein COU78_00970 [Candidatus Peregrinibacteria bacterium CG10_big_fil_rev_8_21_14_0_10_49_24]|nr:MAG: hypothetical protein COV83_01220 [Candidatus Peregrinibacteria bacterium CG11_big_fil_rev_8_21_14_0_20_49_14]PIR51520.1 MAG: hypothetical protein COU78_00970 [Candidatus Peregrinibacteria bacterium CG10_big_fil_rev_8_21_14_0_10_49_24]PJA67837.1 MAG: hypothetical protein CO157_02370 [Candidatus Peregrinibacteria bacterium CG_4_9_14_3_um_filter_49_12]